MKKYFAALLGLTIVFSSAAVAKSRNCDCDLSAKLAEAPCQASTVALSAPAHETGLEIRPQRRDTRYDWQDRIRENRDRYAN